MKIFLALFAVGCAPAAVIKPQVPPGPETTVRISTHDSAAYAVALRSDGADLPCRKPVDIDRPCELRAHSGPVALVLDPPAGPAFDVTIPSLGADLRVTRRAAGMTAVGVLGLVVSAVPIVWGISLLNRTPETFGEAVNNPYAALALFTIGSLGALASGGLILIDQVAPRDVVEVRPLPEP